MTEKEKRIMFLLVMGVAIFGMPRAVQAMHIAEGFLSLPYCVAWGVICLPFLALGLFKMKKIFSENRRTVLIFAMVGAYAFVLSALKLPSVTGSSSHPTGTGLGAILFGPAPMAVVGIIVLLFQAILLAHGGLTTLGANTFSMAIAGPFASYGVFWICRKCKMNRLFSIFLAASIGDLFTYCVTSVQLAAAYPSEIGGFMASIQRFMAVFAVTQIPLAIVEGILTVVVVIGLETYARPELSLLGFIKEEQTA